MKKSSILFSIIFFILLITGLNAEAVGKISFLIGKVSIKSPGSTWKNVKVGDFIPANSIIQTGFKGICRITLNKNMGDITLKPLSVFSVAKINSGENGISGSLKSKLSIGSMRSNIRKRGGFHHRFKVFTPTATAAVRGTKFELSTYPDFGTTLRVLESIVDLLQLPPVTPGADPLIKAAGTDKQKESDSGEKVAEQMKDSSNKGETAGFSVGRGEKGSFNSKGKAESQYDDIVNSSKIDFNSGGLSSEELDALLESAFGTSDIGSILEFFSESDNTAKKVRPIKFKKL